MENDVGNAFDTTHDGEVPRPVVDLSAALVTRVVVPGTINLKGDIVDVENNVWVIGDGNECVVIDAAHDAQPILDAIGTRHVQAILLTHAHNDHINVVPQLAAATGAPALLHPADLPVWELSHDFAPGGELADGDVFTVGEITLTTLHTPGHTPGACSFYSEHLGAVFTGDTLFQGGPGATGRPFSSFPTIIDSIRTRLLSLPAATVVHTGHGPDTTIAAESADLDEWLARGY